MRQDFRLVAFVRYARGPLGVSYGSHSRMEGDQLAETFEPRSDNFVDAFAVTAEQFETVRYYGKAVAPDLDRVMQCCGQFARGQSSQLGVPHSTIRGTDCIDWLDDHAAMLDRIKLIVWQTDGAVTVCDARTEA